MRLSVIIPVRDEQDSIPILAEELTRRLTEAGLSWEALWVDDGSMDGTLAALRELPSPHRYLSLDRNHGMSAAYRAGFVEAKGEWLATLDGDGQNDPADLPRLLDMAQRHQADYVSGIRTPRRDHVIRRISSRIANGVRNLATGVRIQDAGCSTRLLRRECLAYFPFFHGDFLFFPAFVALHGGVIIELPVNHRPRVAGRAHFGISNRALSGLMDLIGVCWLIRRHRTWQVVEKRQSR